MHSSEMKYADEGWGEMEAAQRRRMGCCPLGRMISRAIINGNGRDGRMRKERMDYAMAYSPAQSSYLRPAARNVTVTPSAAAAGNAHAHAAAPEPAQAYSVLPGAPFAAAPARAGGGNPRKKKKKSKRVGFTPDGPAPPPHVAHPHQHPPEGMRTAAPAAAETGSAGGHGGHHQLAGAEPYSTAEAHGLGYGYGHGRSSYAPSPVARWDMLGGSGSGGTPRRYEYFSGEYRWCYPTPVREGIYSIATDANRLTAIFSEENPNACTIV